MLDPFALYYPVAALYANAAPPSGSPPNFISSSNVTNYVGGGAVTNLSVTVQTGDLIIAGVLSETNQGPATVSGGSLTWTSRIGYGIGGNTVGWLAVFTAEATSNATFNVAFTAGALTCSRTYSVQVWRNAKIRTLLFNGSSPNGSMSYTRDTRAVDSALSFHLTNTGGTSGASRVYNTATAGAFTETAWNETVDSYVGYYANAGTVAAKSIGLTTPSLSGASKYAYSIALELGRTAIAIPTETFPSGYGTNPRVIGRADVTGGSGSNIVVTQADFVGTAPQNGDLLIAFLSKSNDQSSGTLNINSVPSGWRVWSSENDRYVFVKIAGASEGTYTWGNDSTVAAMTLTQIIVVDNATEIDIVGTSFSGSITAYTPSSFGGNDGLAILYGYKQNYTSIPSTISVSSFTNENYRLNMSQFGWYIGGFSSSLYLETRLFCASIPSSQATFTGASFTGVDTGRALYAFNRTIRSQPASAPLVRSSASVMNGASPDTVTFTMSSLTYSAGDLLVAVLLGNHDYKSQSPPSFAPAGWTNLGNVFVKIASASESNISATGGSGLFTNQFAISVAAVNPNGRTLTASSSCVKGTNVTGGQNSSYKNNTLRVAFYRGQATVTLTNRLGQGFVTSTESNSTLAYTGLYYKTSHSTMSTEGNGGYLYVSAGYIYDDGGDSKAVMIQEAGF
jgi:hypothetical protein